MPIRVLAVDDETSLTELLSMAMRYEGWQVTTAASGNEAVKAARETRPDAIVLDMMLPDFDGLEVMRRIRAESPDVPVIFLTAKDSVEDRIGGLTAGGDDYVTKPFSLEEVIARLRALLRRSGAALAKSDSTLVVGDLTLDEDSHEVTRGGVDIQLTATEFELLRYLMRNPRRVLSKAQILDRVWNYDFGGQANVVELYISYLRKKIDAQSSADDPHDARSGLRVAPGRLMAEVLATPPRESSPLARGTLGRQLVIRVTALVALAAILLSAATALATRTILLGQIDQQLDAVASRSQRADPRGQQGPGRQLSLSGQPIDSIAAVFAGDGSARNGVILIEDHGPSPLPADVLDVLGALPTGGKRHSVQLPGIGHYRIVGSDVTVIAAGQVQPGSAYWGLSLAQVDRALVNLLGLELILTLLAMVGAALGARAVVVRSLRPLNRVAATAQQVSQLELDRGDVAVNVRVSPEDADPSSEVGRVGQAINHMLVNVDGALAARQASEVKVRQFVADASHELRNPLAAIRGYAELTRRDRAALPEEAAYAMARVESEAERMSHLVEDLLLLARLDSGPDLDLAPTDLTEIVINAVNDARAAGPDHVWQLALPEEPVLALGDQHRLHQVVANLLANARTHTPAGTRVQSSVSIADGQAVITITDNGPGIPQEIQDQVFERFTRADTSRVRAAGAAQGKSTGLGLAIVSAVVEAHRGTVQVSSQPGHTEFTVRLPLAVETRPSHGGPGPDMVASA